MLKFAAGLYRLMLKGKNTNVYFSTILMLVLMFTIHVAQIVLVFNIPLKWVIIWSPLEPKYMQWIKGAIYLGALVFIFSRIFRKSKLETISISEESERRYKVIIPLYIALNILVMLALLVKSGIDKGKF